jgi:hypothetical protein
MNVRIAGLFGLAALVAGAAVSCKSDPTADGAGTPSQVLVNFKSFTLNVGDSTTVTAQVVDIHSTPLELPITFSPCDASVTVGLDPSYDPHPPLSERAIIHAVGPNATCVVASASGAKSDTSSLLILPTGFDGAVSPTTQAGGDTITISSTAVLKFTATTGVTFGGGHEGLVVAQTADQLKVLVPFSDPGTLSFTNVALTYLAGSLVSLPGSVSVTQTGDFWGTAPTSWQTAPDITALLPASGATSGILVTDPSVSNAAVCPEAALGFGSSGPCMMFKFVLADTATLNFTTAWEGDAFTPDVDIYACADSTVANFGNTCFEDGGTGATGSLPQATGNHQYPAGVHWFVIEVFDNSSPTKNITTTISRP